MTYIEPLLTIFLTLTLVGWFSRRKPYGSRLVLAGLAGLLLTSWTPAAWLFSRPLEIWYPVQPFRAAPFQAIVVFSSGVRPPIWERPYPLPDEQTSQRCWYAAWLYHHWQHVPIVVCGGSPRAQPKEAPFSRTMRTLLEESGVPPEMIWADEQSRTTHENAVYGARILQQHGITSAVLVVDATSMPRAAACLRKAGIQVTPAPSEFVELGSWQDYVPGWKAVRENESTLHEMGGLLWYWLRGWV